MRPAPILQRIALVVAGPVVFFLLVEGALRLSPWNEALGPQRFYGGQLDHSHFWDPDNPLPVPDDDRMENEFHGQKISITKPRGVYRIISIGGSSTWGWPLQETPGVVYPAVLGELLNKRGRDRGVRFEVINAGVGGYSSYQGLAYFKTRLKRLRPDLLTICFGANDGNNNYELGINVSDREYYEQRKTLANRPLYFGATRQLNRLRLFALMGKAVFSVKKKIYPPGPRVSAAEFQSNMEAFISMAREEGFKILFILEASRDLDSPHNDGVECLPGPDGHACRYYTILNRLARAHPDIARSVDTVTMVVENQKQKQALFADVGHYTAAGHRLLTEHIYRVLAESGFLPGGTTGGNISPE